MKRIGLVLIIFLSIALAACGQTPTAPSAASASATPRPPQVKTEPIAASPTLSAEATTTAADSPAPTTASAAQPTETAAEPTAAPTAEATEPAPTATAAAATASPSSDGTKQSDACEDKAAFYDDVSVPDDTSFKHSVEFTKIWRIKNEGTCTWDGYTLVWAGGSAFDAPVANPIPLTRPGDLVDIPVKMHSPNQGGVYTSLWEFENVAGKRFGVNSGGVDLIWVRISVTWYPEGSTSPAASTIPAPAGGCSVEKNSAYVDQILALINAERARNGLAELAFDPRLNAAAQAHSEEMACKNYMDHTGSDGSDWAARVKRAGYSYSFVSENIYAGDPGFGGDAQGAFDWWMNSPIHRDNILSKKITQIGIGFAASSNAQFKGRYTLNFARP